MKKLAWLILIFGAACTTTGPIPETRTVSEPSAPPGWNGSMQELRATLTELEPYLYDTVRYEYPANQELIRAKLEKLSDLSAKVDHDPTVAGRDPTVKFVAARFATHLRRANKQFNDGRRMYARYEIIGVTRFCVECHTRMPGGPQFILGKPEPFLREMPTIDRAEYLISARDFDAAFELLVGTLERASTGVGMGVPYDRVSKLALQVSVQFKQSPALATRVVKAIEENGALPYYLKERARGWKRSIADWQNEKPAPDTVWSLRKQVDGRSTDIEALRALPRVLARLSAAKEGAETAELLGLAGNCYEAIDEISSLGLAQNYYEACIHARPHSAIARACYASLEGSVHMGYSGSGGLRLPGDVERDLRELRDLAQ